MDGVGGRGRGPGADESASTAAALDDEPRDGRGGEAGLVESWLLAGRGLAQAVGVTGDEVPPHRPGVPGRYQSKSLGQVK